MQIRELQRAHERETCTLQYSVYSVARGSGDKPTASKPYSLLGTFTLLINVSMYLMLIHGLRDSRPARLLCTTPFDLSVPAALVVFLSARLGATSTPTYLIDHPGSPRLASRRIRSGQRGNPSTLARGRMRRRQRKNAS